MTDKVNALFVENSTIVNIYAFKIKGYHQTYLFVKIQQIKILYMPLLKVF